MMKYISNLVFYIQVIYSLSETDWLLCYIDFIGSTEQALYLHETSNKLNLFGEKCILTYTNKNELKYFHCVHQHVRFIATDL